MNFESKYRDLQLIESKNRPYSMNPQVSFTAPLSTSQLGKRYFTAAIVHIK